MLVDELALHRIDELGLVLDLFSFLYRLLLDGIKLTLHERVLLLKASDADILA